MNVFMKASKEVFSAAVEQMEFAITSEKMVLRILEKLLEEATGGRDIDGIKNYIKTTKKHIESAIEQKSKAEMATSMSASLEGIIPDGM